MKMAFCATCGSKIKKEDAFCTNCGAKLVPDSKQEKLLTSYGEFKEMKSKKKHVCVK